MTKRYQESAEQKAKRRAREVIKRRRRRARKRAALAAERAKQAGSIHSKTSAAYRQIHFGVAPEMTKSELRNVLAQAVRNTVAMGARA